ncbi:MAG: hypothetical protein QM811_10110 [Pirellulales bacterium]
MIHELRERLNLIGKRVDDAVRIESPEAHRLVARVVEAFPGRIESVTLGRPNLEDVFIAKTGSRFLHVETPPEPAGKRKR